MSFEGYYQLLCASGHYWTEDVYSVSSPERSICEICGKHAVWSNLVDLTNGRSEGCVELELLTGDQWCTCKVCGNEHTSNNAIYKVPEES